MKYGIIISNENGVVERLRFLFRDFAVLQTASGGEESIPDLLQCPADFLILDSFLSGMDQLAVLNKLLTFQKQLSVIALVPSIHSPLVPELQRAGVYAVVEKDFDKRGLLELVERASERRQLMGEIEYLRERKEDRPKESFFEPSNESRIFSREVLRRFSKVISHVRDHDKLINLAIETIVETFNAGKAIILLFDPRTGRYKQSSFYGYKRELAESMVFGKADDLPAWLIKHRQILVVSELSGSLGFELYRQIGLLAPDIVIGLFAQGDLIGILAIGKKVVGKSYSEDDLQLISIMTDYLAVAIENATLYRDIAAERSHNEKVLNSLKTGVITVNLQGDITTFNRAAGDILELTSGNIIGESVERLGSRFADLLRRTLAGEGEYYRLEVEYPVNNKPLGVGISVMLNDSGWIDGAVMVFTDLTRIKRMEEQTKDNERIKFWAILAGRLAHEVKNPLVPIKTFAQLLPERYGDENFREEFYMVVNKEIDRLNDISTRLTRFAESPRPRKEPVGINEILEQVLELLAPRLEEKKIRVTREFKLGGEKTSADGDLLREAFTNILDNAVDAVSNLGAITIATALRCDSGVEVIFKDTGSGMNGEELKDIFIPFTGTRMGGMGLGLPIARRIIKDHQGSLEVESTPGQGTSVRVLLPRGEGECKQAKA